MAACHPSAIDLDADPAEPDWPIIYISTPSGQLSWYLSAEDLDLFDHVSRMGAPAWDGHTTEEKYRRLRELTARQRALR